MDINIIVEKQDWLIIVNKLFIDKLNIKSISIVASIEEKKDEKKTKLVKDNSLFKIQVSENFVVNHFAKKSAVYKKVLKEFKNVFQVITQKSDEIIKQHQSFSAVSVVYKYKENLLHFPFDFLGIYYIKAFESSLNQILSLIKEENPSLEKSIKEFHNEGNNNRVFLYKDNNWEVIDPLVEIAASTNKKYRENKDPRIRKPLIIVNRDNIWKYFVFDTNWVLVFDKLETMLVQPNDVSLYSNIAEKNLNEARLFYDKHVAPRHEYYHGSFPSEKTQKEYFDYFELIIQAVIFSYTSLEAFANICIPPNYKYSIEKEGIKTIYSKEAIERKFSLREKFKNVLQEILITEDVTRSKWWATFIKLEDIRNEIIHSKPSKSENRYSKLLEKKIFDTVMIHRIIIEYYGSLITKNRTALLNEFPYDFGFDNVSPGMMNDKEYEKSYRVIHNIKM